MNVTTANICLDCDFLHDQCECPKCMSKSSYPLRKWLKPMTTFSEIQEEKKNAKMDHKVQERPEGRVHVTDRRMLVDSVISLPVGFSLSLLPSDHAARFAQDYSDESQRPKVSPSDNRGGIELDSERRFKQRRDWFDAGTSAIRKGLRRFLSK